jgi:hypothetical protein
MHTKIFLAALSIGFYPEIIALAEQHWVCPLDRIGNTVTAV